MDPEDLTDLEQQLLTHVKAGTILDLDTDLPQNQRTIRADTIRDILIGTPTDSNQTPGAFASSAPTSPPNST